MGAEHQTKTKIKEAALRLFVEQGVSETTVRDLANAIGMAEGTLYRHYATKEELTRELSQEHYAAFADRIRNTAGTQESLRGKLRAIAKDACRLFDTEPTLYRFLLLIQHETLPRLPKGSANPLAAVRSVIAEGIKQGEAKITDPQLGAAMVLGLLIQPALALVHGSLSGPLSRYADDIASACERVIIR